jgi:hypothetical protein
MDGKRWDTDNFSSDLRDANRKAKLCWGCLDYRHTFGSQLAMKGESLYKISAMARFSVLARPRTLSVDAS